MSKTIFNELEDLVDDKLKIGDSVMWRGSWGQDDPKKVKVTGIGKGKEWDETYQEIPWSKLKDDVYTVDIETKDFLNKKDTHWAYGYQLSPLGENVSEMASTSTWIDKHPSDSVKMFKDVESIIKKLESGEDIESSEKEELINFYDKIKQHFKGVLIK